MNQNNQQQFVAPQGTMKMSMKAPSNYEGKTKRTDIQLFPDGPQPAVIYCAIGLGTHTENFQGTGDKQVNKIYVGFEFPQLKQLFYIEDTEPRSTIMSVESSYSMGSKSKLRAICEAVIGRKFSSDDEAYDFDISQIIGAKVLVNVATKYRKKDNTPYNDIGSVIPLGQYPLPPNFNPEIEYNIFGIDENGDNFKTMNYAKIPFYLKKIILESKEAKEYIAKGGVFAKMPDNQQQGSQQSFQQNQTSAQAPAPAPVPAAAPPQKKFILTDTSFSLEQWKNAQWTEQMLVDGGKGYWEEPAPAPMAPPPSAAVPQAPPQAPTPQTPQPQAPQQQFQQQAFASQAEQQQQAQNWLSEEDDDDMPF